jgi:predicted nucleic acid-binding protein
MTRLGLMVDAWAWIALYNPSDQHYAIATLAQEELLKAGYRWYTTNFVLDEAYTALRRWGSHHRAVQFGRRIRAIVDSSVLEVVAVTPEVEHVAWELFERYDTVSDLSYTDCTTATIMQDRRIRTIFTGDGHFRVMGFEVQP